MVDSIAVFPPAFRILNADGTPASGAQVRFWEGGTNNPLAVNSAADLGGGTSLGSIVYTRSDGLMVASQGSQTTVSVYTGSAPYDVDVVDENDVTIVPRKINQRGALDTSSFITTQDASNLNIPVLTVNENITADATFNGKVVNLNTTSGSRTVTLESATVLGNGWNFEVRKGAAANVAVLQTSSAEIINFNGQAHTSLALSALGEGLSIRCDGAAFYVGHYTPPLRNTAGIITIADRVTSAPAGPTPGARYIVTTGFSTFATEDIIEADASGGFIKYTPEADCGWIAYVQDEDTLYQFRGSAWVTLAAGTSQPGLVELASTAEMETATDLERAVTPGRQHSHPAHPKAWARHSGNGGSLLASYGISGVVENSLGNYTVTLSPVMSSVNYAVLVTADFAGASRSAQVDNRTTSTFRVLITSGSLGQAEAWSCLVVGDQ